CSNCGAMHMPLWSCELNDKLNCNACGLHCKLVGLMMLCSAAQCYNCHMMATPLWHKDDEGKTVCNVYVLPHIYSYIMLMYVLRCGLYYKLHGSVRPISMKLDVIRKCSQHYMRRGGTSVSKMPTASPGVSCRTSSTLVPDSMVAQITRCVLFVSVILTNPSPYYATLDVIFGVRSW
ncbi:hypothetical protein B0H10DRAFT_1804499, partial [Mycena sp. CBHHK59/15]